MFGLGFGELLVLAFIGIVILGPKRCVGVAKSLGKIWISLKKEWQGIKKDLSVDEEINDLKKDIELDTDYEEERDNGNNRK